MAEGEGEKMTQWKQGESGNPKGRPRGGFPLSKALKEVLYANDGEALKAIVEKIVEKARAGDPHALKMLMERVDGPAKGERDRIADDRWVQISHWEDWRT